MSLWKIAWRNIQQRWLASALTAFSIGLGVALVVAVLVIHGVIEKSFRRNAQGYDMIVGAKGDPLLLVLNTVLHMNLRQSLQTIPYSYYEEFTEGRFVPAVETAIPVCTGHDYRGCPVVATTPEMFEKLTYLDDKKYEFPVGRNFEADKPFEAVAGYDAARIAKLKLNDTFQPTAGGSAGADGHKDEEPFTLVGVLAPTGTPTDRVIFTNIEGFFRCPSHQGGPSAAQKLLSGAENAAPGEKADAHDKAAPKEKPAEEKPASEKPAEDKSADEKVAKDEGHDHEAAPGEAGHDAHDEHGGHDHDAHRKLTAILVCTNPKRIQLGMALVDVINREPTAQAVRPVSVIDQLLSGIVGDIQALLLVLAVLVVIVAGIGILVSIYNSMSERRHDIAVMRALGASRGIVMAVILLESILLALGGGLMGLLMGHGVIGMLSGQIAEKTRVNVGMFDFQMVELVLVPGLVLLAAAVGYLPAVVAYRTDVAKSLHKD